MDTQPLLDLITGITAISPGFRMALQEKLVYEQYLPHQVLRAAGQVENRIYFIQHGFARDYIYDTDGQEHTVKFRQPGDIVFSFEGYGKAPCYFYTEMLAAAKLVTLTYDHLRELAGAHREVSALVQNVVLGFQKEEYQRQNLLLLPTPERYRQFRKKHNELFQLVPSRIIASYLHISRETLNRLIAKY